jgi:diguanylate cyclase (GGDEF)-like protein
LNNHRYHILFIDDDRDFLNSLRLGLSKPLFDDRAGVEIEHHFLNDPNEGLAFVQELAEEKEKIAVIVSDQQMPVLTGIELMEKASAITPNTLKILLTGYASLDSAKYAINNRILDHYVTKPIENHDSFVSLIVNATKTFHFREEKERAEQAIQLYVKELELKNEKIRKLHLAAEKIAYVAQGLRKLEIDDVLDLIIAKIPSIFGAKYSSLFLLDEKENSLQMVRSNHLSETYTIPLDSGTRSPMLCALRENRTIVISEIGQGSHYDLLHKERLGDSCIIIPFVADANDHSADIISNHGATIKGVLNMGNIADMPGEDVVHYTASLVQNILGINILNARLYQKTQQLALFDGLTGLYNKNIFLEFLNKECDYSERFQSPLFLAFGDVDDFKAVNDTYGHLIGDEVLRQLGRLFKQMVRKYDVVGRFGGDEFVWLITGCDPANIRSFFERIRSAASNSELGNVARVSVSIGVASYNPGRHDSEEQLIDRADKALYRAKANGKSRVEVSFDGHE